MIVTQYSAGYESTQKKRGESGYGITASGKRVEEGVTVACGPSIAFGTRVYIAELRHEYVCQDRGSRIHDNNIDIYVADVRRAKDFGRREMDVRIITEEDD